MHRIWPPVWTKGELLKINIFTFQFLVNHKIIPIIHNIIRIHLGSLNMKIKVSFVVLFMAFSLNSNIAQANIRPVVESFTITPNNVELI